MFDDLDLKSMREAAGLRQADLAAEIGVAQSQIARYEGDPDKVPMLVWREYKRICGQAQAAPEGLDVGSPYAGVASRVEVLRAYAGREPRLEQDDTLAPPIRTEDLLLALEELGRKPRIALRGRYDAGKSHMANVLLGQSSLVAQYQPATRINCLLRHMDDKPKGQVEDVLILKEGFRLTDVNDWSKCEPYIIARGDLDTLWRFGARGSERDSDKELGKPIAAVAYLDSPLLRACDLLDTPGLGNDAADAALSDSATVVSDAVLYLSQFTGFLDQSDRVALAALVAAVPSNDEEAPLRRLSIVASHVYGRDQESQASAVLSAGAEHLATALSRPGATSGTTLDAVTLRTRMFTWWADSKARSASFRADLEDLLGRTLPRTTHRRLDNAVAAFREQATAFYEREAAHLRRILQEREAAERELRAREAAEPKRRAASRAQVRRIEAVIAEALSAVPAFMAARIEPALTAERIETLIRESYPSRDQAEKDVGLRLVTDLQNSLAEFVNEAAEKLGSQVEELLQTYTHGLDGSAGTMFFDARAAFFGGLAAGAAFGALAGWAALAGATATNLGAYVLVPQVVGLLARLGIGIAGGTATGVSIVAALGGPITIGVGLAATVGMIAYQVFGRAWQVRLAENVAEKAKEKELSQRAQDWLVYHFEETRAAFRRAAEELEKEHAAVLTRLREQTRTPGDRMQARLRRAEAMVAYLTYLPWSPAGEVK